MIEKFYSDFEAVFRGSKDLIKDRLRQYTPILESYLRNSEKPSFLDLGCGRGEFLEIAHNLGFDATGVEINSVFAEESQIRGLKVYNQDILEFIKSQPDKSYDVISLIHVAEHLDFEYLFDVFVNVHRLLKPCGIFIMETPFFKSPLVSSYTFWIDPSHRTPINPELFSFLGKWVGFYKVEYFGINSDMSSKFESLTDLYSYKVAPDLAMFFIKECSNTDIVNSIENTIQTLKDKYMSTQLENLLNSYTRSQFEQINNIRAQIQHIHQNLDSFIQKYNSDYNHLSNLIYDTRTVLFLIWDSNLWKTYRKSVEAYRKIRRLLRIGNFSEIRFKIVGKLLKSYKLKKITKKLLGDRLFETIKRKVKGNDLIMVNGEKKLIDVGSLDKAIRQEIVKIKHQEGRDR